MAAPAHKLLLGAAGGTAGGNALPTQILALSPRSYWKLRDNDANTLHDYGSLALNLTQGGNPVTLAAEAGSDGFSYPDTDGTSSDEHMFAADDIGYEPQNASGLTVGFLFKQQGPVGATQRQIVNKIDSSGAGSWQIQIFDDGTLRAQTITGAAGLARRRQTGSAAVGAGWTMIITRWSSSSTGFPSIRIAGSNVVGSTSGTGSATSNSTQTVKLFGHGGTTGHPECALAHVFVYAGELSDANCGLIEAAATTDGW